MNESKLDCGILGIYESRILKFQSSCISLSLQNYAIEETPNETTAGELLMCINKIYSNKTYPHLPTYEAKKLESTSSETILPKKSNLIVGSINRNSCMDICTFHCLYLKLLSEKLSKEANKTVFLLRDFNGGLLNFDTLVHVNTFLNDVASNSL